MKAFICWNPNNPKHICNDLIRQASRQFCFWKFIFYKPSYHNFSGLISTCQGFCDEFFYLNISEAISKRYDKENAFDYFNDNDLPTATRGMGWVSFSLKEKYFYITHYE